MLFELEEGFFPSPHLEGEWSDNNRYKDSKRRDI